MTNGLHHDASFLSDSLCARQPANGQDEGKGGGGKAPGWGGYSGPGDNGRKEGRECSGRPGLTRAPER